MPYVQRDENKKVIGTFENWNSFSQEFLEKDDPEIIMTEKGFESWQTDCLKEKEE